MNTLSYKTVSANKQTVTKDWYLIDAEGEVLGRLASKVAKIIRGKNKPSFTPHVDCGDNIVIINAEKVIMTGKKMTDRRHFSHSGYPGGQKQTSPEHIMAKKPTELIRMAVKGMLPKSKLGSQIINNMFIYAGTEHKQEAQNPTKIDLNTIK